MTCNGVTEFATAAIADIAQNQELHGKWNTLLFLRDSETGRWSFKNLRFTSVQKSTDGGFAILSGQKLGKIDDGTTVISTLLDPTKIQQILDGGYELEMGKYHLVRAPINKGGAYAVVGNGFQTVYNDRFQVVASGTTGFIVMPTIDVDGTYTDKVTTVSGSANDWDIRTGLSPRKADTLAPAFGATA
ncbi:MAG: hypothetical protein NUV84_03235 [Candidatus Uhrbacteria bacterium]|nr:hypothetical protein [Candidatus Uhrbacteria bacterium]